MEAILKFNLDKPADIMKFENAVRAQDYAEFVCQFYESFLRPYCKHGVPDRFDGAKEMAAHLREEFINLLNEHGLELLT